MEKFKQDNLFLETGVLGRYGDFADIKEVELINSIDDDKVAEIKKSILKNGWAGAPILIKGGLYGYELITGSHRVSALNQIWDDIEKGILPTECFDFTDVEIENVSDILDVYYENHPGESEYDDFEYDNLSKYFQGCERIDKWKEQISEW